MATLRGDIKQRDLEAYEADYNQRVRDDAGEINILKMGQMQVYGAPARAGVAAGWFKDMATQEAVDDLTGKEIRALHKQVDALYQEMTTLDPNE